MSQTNEISHLGFRLATPEDYDALVIFWCANAGWDIIDRSVWEDRFIDTPLGASEIALAIDEDTREMVGQFIFIPMACSVGGRQVRTYRPFAPVIRQGLRFSDGGNSLQSIIFSMYGQIVEALRVKGAGLIHMIPDPRWSRVFQMVPFLKTATFPLYSLPLPLGTTIALPSRFAYRSLSYSDPRIDHLWVRASLQYRTMLVRDRTFLRWKTRHRDYRLRGLFLGDRLAGLFTSLHNRHDRQFLICDLLAEDEAAMEATLQAACLSAGEAFDATSGESLDKVSLLVTPLLEPAARRLGFSPAAYRFTLVVHQLDASLPEEALAPEAWYVSAND